jgi:hypothetical protein
VSRTEEDAMIFTAWGPDGIADTLIRGEGPPLFADGTLMDPGARLIWTIEADSWEAACQRYHELQTARPCQPMGDP